MTGSNQLSPSKGSTQQREPLGEKDPNTVMDAQLPNDEPKNVAGDGSSGIAPRKGPPPPGLTSKQETLSPTTSSTKENHPPEDVSTKTTETSLATETLKPRKRKAKPSPFITVTGFGPKNKVQKKDTRISVPEDSRGGISRHIDMDRLAKYNQENKVEPTAKAPMQSKKDEEMTDLFGEDDSHLSDAPSSSTQGKESPRKVAKATGTKGFALSKVASPAAEDAPLPKVPKGNTGTVGMQFKKTTPPAEDTGLQIVQPDLISKAKNAMGNHLTPEEVLERQKAKDKVKEGQPVSLTGLFDKDGSDNAPVQMPVQSPMEKSVKKPTDNVVKAPEMKPVREPVQKSVLQPAKKPVGTPTKKPVEKPVEQPAKKAVKAPNAQKPVQKPAKKPVEQPATKPAENAGKVPILKTPVEKPLKKGTAKVVKASTKHTPVGEVAKTAEKRKRGDEASQSAKLSSRKVSENDHDRKRQDDLDSASEDSEKDSLSSEGQVDSDGDSPMEDAPSSPPRKSAERESRWIPPNKAEAWEDMSLWSNRPKFDDDELDIINKANRPRLWTDRKDNNARHELLHPSAHKAWNGNIKDYVPLDEFRHDPDAGLFNVKHPDMEVVSETEDYTHVVTRDISKEDYNAWVEEWKGRKSGFNAMKTRWENKAAKEGWSEEKMANLWPEKMARFAQESAARRVKKKNEKAMVKAWEEAEEAEQADREQEKKRADEAAKKKKKQKKKPSPEGPVQRSIYRK